MMGRAIGPSWGFMALGLNLFGGALGQAVTALGLADYLAWSCRACRRCPWRWR